MAATRSIYEELGRLREENEDLRLRLANAENIAEREEVDALAVQLSKAVRMPFLSGKILALIVLTKSETVSRERLFNDLYGDRLEPPQLKILDVYICRIRARLPHDIKITTVFSFGYSVTYEAKQKILALTKRRTTS